MAKRNSKSKSEPIVPKRGHGHRINDDDDAPRFYDPEEESRDTADEGYDEGGRRINKEERDEEYIPEDYDEVDMPDPSEEHDPESNIPGW